MPKNIAGITSPHLQDAHIFDCKIQQLSNNKLGNMTVKVTTTDRVVGLPLISLSIPIVESDH